MRMFEAGRLAVCAVASVAAGTASAQPARTPIPVESFYRQPSIASASLSPSGRWLAMTMGIGERVQLVALDLEHMDQPVRVAALSDGDVRTFQWVNDERLVAQARCSRAPLPCAM
jgi:hypothetical protein